MRAYLGMIVFMAAMFMAAFSWAGEEMDEDVDIPAFEYKATDIR